LLLRADPEGLEEVASLARARWKQVRADQAEQMGLALPALHVQADASARGWCLELRGIPEAQGQEAAQLPQALEALAREHGALALGPQEVHQRLEELRQVAPRDVEAVVPARVSVLELTEVMQALVAQQVPVRDLRTLLLSVARAPAQTLAARVEAARQGLRRSITWRFCGAGRSLRAWQLHPEVEAMLRDCLRREGEGQVELRLPAGIRREILAAARYAVGQEAQVVVLTTPELRPWVYQILKAELPVVVLSYAELLEQVRVEVAGTISVMG
jgi:flagellar biosynthesis protein FlhA